MAHVGTQDDFLSAVSLQPTHKQLGLRDGDAADGHHRGTRGKCLLNILVGLDAAAEIDRQLGFRRNLTEHLAVHDVLRLRAVQIDHVQSLVAYALELKRHIQRLAIHRLLVIIALGQSHALTVDNIDGRYKLYFHPLQVIIYKLSTINSKSS